eukprot:13142818-Ditylum_brightwellii.AAC.1
MQKSMKCKLVDTANGKFYLIEALHEGDALMHWLKYKQVEIAWARKNPDGMDTPPLGMCNLMFTVFLQELKKHYFLKNVACLQKAYLCNCVKNGIN